MSTYRCPHCGYVSMEFYAYSLGRRIERDHAEVCKGVVAQTADAQAAATEKSL